MTLDEEDIRAIGRGHFGCEKYVSVIFVKFGNVNHWAMGTHQ